MKSFFAVLLPLLLVACGEPLPTVKVTGGNPLSFRVGGRTETLIFSICCAEGAMPDGEHSYVWEVRNNHEPDVKLPFDVVYGTTPKGFRQISPEDNKTPTPLVPGRKYSYWAQGMYGAKVGCFEIRDKGVVDVECKE